MEAAIFFRENKSKILITVLLITINAALIIFILPKAKETGVDQSKPASISVKEAETILREVLVSFGIRDSMLSSTKAKRGGKKLGGKFLTAKIPADVPVPFILYDLQTKYAGKGVELVSGESKINSVSITEIILSSTEKITCEFQVQKELTREEGTVNFLLTDVSELSDEEFAALLRYDQFVSFMVPASSKGRHIAEILKRNEKAYAVYLSDDVSEIEFQLKEKFSLTRLRSTIKTIISAFPNASFYYTVSSSHIYSSSIRHLFELGLKPYDKKLISEKEVKYFPETEDDSHAAGWLVSSIKSDYSPVKVLITGALYSRFQNVFAGFRKRGGRMEPL